MPLVPKVGCGVWCGVVQVLQLPSKIEGASELTQIELEQFEGMKLKMRNDNVWFGVESID